MIKTILQGVVIGIANIIPGVSGGTMMVAMGLYDRLIHAITHIKSEFKNSLKLLIPILAGAALAIVLLSRLFEFLLDNYPIPTNFAFCGLIVGSLPFIVEKVKGSKAADPSNWIPFVIFFAIVVGSALFTETNSSANHISLNIIEIIKLFLVGVIAAATMVIPGVSGSMMLMLLGYYDTILATINSTIDALIGFDIPALLTCAGLLIPFGIGVIIGIFLIAKLIEFIFSKWETSAYYAIIGLIVSSPVAILVNTDWQGFSLITLIISIITFIVGWFVASKLGKE